ncbi:hypothetical protein GCM10009647_035910 [Streptomyces sanglieri]
MPSRTDPDNAPPAPARVPFFTEGILRRLFKIRARLIEQPGKPRHCGLPWMIGFNTGSAGTS